MTEPILELEFEKVERLEKELDSYKKKLDLQQKEIERLQRELAAYQNR